MISKRGTGIRGRPKSSRRLKTTDCGVVSVNDINRGSLYEFVPVAEALREKGRLPCLDDLPQGSRQVEATIQWPGRQPRTVWLDLTATRVHFGGFRQWLRCPRCGARVGKLYVPASDAELGCRECWQLVYESQYLGSNPILAHIKKVRRVSRLLEGILSIGWELVELGEDSGKGGGDT